MTIKKLLPLGFAFVAALSGLASATAAIS